MKKLILDAKQVLVGVSRNGRIVLTLDGERHIASAAISKQVIAGLDEDLDETEKAVAMVEALAGYVIYENEIGVKFIANQASEAVAVTVDKNAINKVKTVEAETFEERLSRIRGSYKPEDLTVSGYERAGA